MPTDPSSGGITRHPGGCLQPVLLRGRVDHIDGATGELLHRYTTVHEPAGVLPIACKTRRASQCPPCAEVYRADTYQLIRAGLSGGKGIPATVAEHPCVFTTLTAPSFGPVHAQRKKDGRLLRCRPRRRGGTCPHGRPMSCPERHTRDDPRLGEPLCPDCYDYTRAVLFNACAPELWRQFTITLRRTLARQTGLTNKALSAQVRVSFAKVAEYQRRGVVHFHAIIRLDGPAGPTTAPPAWATLVLLTAAIDQAARMVHLETLPELRRHLEAFAERGPGALAFPGAKGGPLRRGNFNRSASWPQAVATIGAPGLHFHDLRHAGNTFAAASGAGLRDLMARMGHDSERAALIYQHEARGADAAITNAIDAHVGAERSRDSDVDHGTAEVLDPAG